MWKALGNITGPGCRAVNDPKAPTDANALRDAWAYHVT